MKTIVVTSDLSDESKVALDVAREYASLLEAKLKLVAVIEDPAQAAMMYALDFPVLPDPDIQQQLMDKVKGDLEEIARIHLEGTDYSCFVREGHGPVHEEILQFAKDENADLIIIATLGRTGLTRILIGSVTEKVVRESHVPVLTVPAERRKGKAK